MSEQHLKDSLLRVLAIDEHEPFTKDLARSAIVGSGLEMVIAPLMPPAGWPVGKACTFSRMFTWVYQETLDGKPWKKGGVRA